MIEPANPIGGGELIGEGIPQQRAFPPKTGPFIPDTALHHMSSAPVNVRVSINRSIIAEMLEPAIMRSNRLRCGRIPKVGKPAEAVERFLNLAHDRKPMHHRGMRSRGNHSGSHHSRTDQRG